MSKFFLVFQTNDLPSQIFLSENKVAGIKFLLILPPVSERLQL
jgi:hypothetical protein